MPVRRGEPETTAVYDSYWRLAAERQRIFFRRQRGEAPPWTTDPILRAHKFTNAYRASDRVSQFLIRQVIYAGAPEPRELFFRVMLFKFFNRIETWELLTREFGEVSAETYCFENYDRVLEAAMGKGDRIYSAAYIMPSAGRVFNVERKHQGHLLLLDRMMRDELWKRIGDVPAMAGAFELLLGYPSIGGFLAYQYVIDLNYSPLINFSENDFVVPGPGALDGISKCFADRAGMSETELITWVCDRQGLEFKRLGIEFDDLWGRPLQLIDCQNLFCEVSKYARVHHPDVAGVAGRTRIKQAFNPSPAPLSLKYPPKWGLDDRVSAWTRDHGRAPASLFTRGGVS